MNLTLAICVYNAAKYLPETLDSVLAQSRQDFKLMIVNDCSTDDSIDIINEYFKRNPRQYDIVSFDENHGICYARRYAERNADTEYLMFLDADDLLRPKAIELMWNKISSDTHLMAVGCWLEYIDRKGHKIGGGLFLGETNKDKFIDKAAAGKLIFMQPTAIYHRPSALRVGGYEIDGFPQEGPRYQDFCEDLDLWTRMSDLYTEGKAIVVIPKVLCSYRKGGGLSSNTFNMILKMRYTKTNVRRRRTGKDNLTFTEFYDSLTQADINQLKKEAYAADNLRNGVMLLKQKKVLSGGIMVLKSIIARPSYFLDKLKHNL